MKSNYDAMTLEEMNKEDTPGSAHEMDFYVAWAGKMAQVASNTPKGHALKTTLAELAVYEQRYGIPSEDYYKALEDGLLKPYEDVRNWGFAIQTKKYLERKQST